MIMFQSKVSKFKFKSNPSLVYTHSFLKVFKLQCLRSKISLCTNLPYACLSIYLPLLRSRNYMNQEVFQQGCNGATRVNGLTMKKRYIKHKVIPKDQWSTIFYFLITSIPLTLHNKTQIALPLPLLFYFFFKTIFFTFFFHLVFS